MRRTAASAPDAASQRSGKGRVFFHGTMVYRSLPPERESSVFQQAGEQTAYLSGTLANGQTVVREKIVLSSVPRVLDDVFYLPLEDVISALGGVCLVDGTTVRVLLLGQDVTYFAGESPVLWNDRAWMPEEDPARPFLWNQAFYLPLSYATPLFQEGILRTGEYGIVWG